MKTLKIKCPVSVKGLIILLLILCFVNLKTAYSQLIVTPAKDTIQAEALADSLLTGFGITISNATYRGQLVKTIDGGFPGYQIGSFTTGADTTNLGITHGIIMSNGDVTRASQPNTLISNSDFYNYFCECEVRNGDPICVENLDHCQWSDADLDSILGCTGCTYDATSLEFDFTTNSTNLVSFRYVFASDEWPEYVCSVTNDVFAIFVTGPKPGGGNYTKQNIALVPGKNESVSINTINSGSCGSGWRYTAGCDTTNKQYYVNNANGKTIVYNAFTKVLTATLDVIPKQQYHIKFAIADVGDGSYDSSIFLEDFSAECKTPTPTVAGASRCGPGSVTLQASGGTTYLWYNSEFGGNVINTGPTFVTPALNISKAYYVSNLDSCESAREPVIAYINTLNIRGENQTISCGDTVLLNTNTTYNGSNKLTYAWTPTTGLSSSSIANPYAFPGQTTTYTVMVSDSNCSSYANIVVNINTAYFNLDLSADPQILLNPPFAIAFNNQTANIDNYNFTWYFGDGSSLKSNNSTVFHTYTQNGLYDITLVAVNTTTGCSDNTYKPGYINCTGGTNCTHTATINQPSPIYGCIGTPVLLTCKTVSGATYQWNYNGVAVSNSNDTTYYANATGNYSVTIILDSCSKTSNIVLIDLKNPPTIPTITSTGNLIYCIGGSDTLTASGVASTYLWSNGKTTQTIIVNTPGIYTVMITDNYGCTSQSLPYIVGTSPVANPDICMVTVDGITGKNEVVWNRPDSKAINHFNVYSEGAQANVFNLIGKVPWDSLTVFIDSSSIPAQQSYLYQLSIVDTCGAETQLSAYHQTIHLSINQGMGTTWNLIWNYYIGFTFPSYNIYRGTSPSNMTLLKTIASTLNSYTDLNPPAGYLYYQVVAVNPDPCIPTKGKSNEYGSTKSNIASNNSAFSVNNYVKDKTYINIYPNPTNNTVNIDFPAYTGKGKTLIELYRITGGLIRTLSIQSRLTQINIANLAKGVYIIKVMNDNIVAVKRIVKE